jgi:hypothetical protein
MFTQPVLTTVVTPERFDCNQVEFAGVVTKIWSRSDGDVFARMRMDRLRAPGDQLIEEEDEVESNSVDARLTVRFPNGQLNDQDISLLKGDVLRVRGYLSDTTQWESLRDFLLKARQPDLIQKIPDLAAAFNAQVKRAVTYVIPEMVEFIQGGKDVPLVNTARLEGVVARVWEYGGHLFTRVAVYDQHTTTTGEAGNNGRNRRVPHYITVQFTDEQVDGRTVGLKARDRMRVTGSLGSRVYSENLRSFLLSAHQGQVLATLSNGDAADEVWTAYIQTCLLAQTLILYTKR